MYTLDLNISNTTIKNDICQLSIDKYDKLAII